ncbi:hypothetical protein R3P38DRAFT_3045928 [Favolaschia claudopus]|uniref:Secreted protein n=1 Tax=Favolaschia claudopus TaxID=2862362 RepID=A0AAW0A6R3_9AGAR
MALSLVSCLLPWSYGLSEKWSCRRIYLFKATNDRNNTVYTFFDISPQTILSIARTPTRTGRSTTVETKRPIKFLLTSFQQSPQIMALFCSQGA